MAGPYWWGEFQIHWFGTTLHHHGSNMPDFFSGKGALAPVHAKSATDLKRVSLDRNPLEARG